MSSITKSKLISFLVKQFFFFNFKQLDWKREKNSNLTKSNIETKTHTKATLCCPKLKPGIEREHIQIPLALMPSKVICMEQAQSIL